MSGVGAEAAVDIESLTLASLASVEAEWRDLAARAAEPNPFADPAFLIPALRHLAPRGLRALAVWSRGDRRLIGIAVLRAPRALPGLAEVWRSEQAALPALVFDRNRGATVLTAVLRWLDRESARALGLVIPELELGGATIAALRMVSQARSLRLELLSSRKRAALAHLGANGFESALDAKRLKEWRRRRRRLAEGGAVNFSWSADRKAIETFLALEARGWKGSRGAALAADARRERFASEMLTAFAARGDGRIARLERSGSTIAAGVVLRAGSRAYYWKTAYDEELSKYSPGVQLTLEMSRALERDPQIALTDSCAVPEHPMIDRLWPDRLDLVDAAIALRPGALPGFSLAIRARVLRNRAREAAKRKINAWLGR